MTVFEKIEAQQKGLEDTIVWEVGEQLKAMCRADPHCAEIVAADLENPDMSIQKADRQKEAARQELRKVEEQLEKARKESLLGSPDVAVFKAVFGAVQADFDRLREALAKVRGSDPEVGVKLTAATKALLEKLADDIGS